jgi:lipoprotein-anchoring transpeptidase ErfK/SrfK
VRIAIALPLFFCAAISSRAQTSVEIDLEEQMAYLLKNGRVALASPISSGRYGHLTERGSFKVLEKERTHYSSMYGKIVDSRGNTIVADADADMPIPAGGKFIPAPMHYFMRFAGADGMHAGYLPGNPASHGCVRMPERVRNCVLQFSQRWHSGHGVRKDPNRALPGAITTDLSKGP